VLLPLIGGLVLLSAFALAMTPRGQTEPAVARAEAPTIQTATVAGTDGSGVRIRSGPGRQHATLATLAEGTVLTILGGPRSDGEREWLQVERADAAGYPLQGWVASQYLAVANHPAAGTALAGPVPTSRLVD
jgi:uncharacterized protein YraI